MTGGSPGSPHPGMAADKYISFMYGERSKPRENVRPSGKAVSFRVLLSRVFSRLYIIYYLLFIIYYLLFIIIYLLFIIYYLLFII